MTSAPKNINRRLRRQRGVGLLETMLCISLMSLLFLGAMTLIVSASRLTVRTQAQVYATGDAANALQNVMSQIREASSFSLPTSNTANTPETAWSLLSGTSLTQFSTTLTMNGTPETINTAIQVAAPLVLMPGANGYPAPLPAQLRVLSTAGGGAFWSAGQGTWTAPPINISVPGSVGFPSNTVYLPTPGSAAAVYLIYRGDANYAPDPAAGTYLWEYAIPANAAFNPAAYPPTALCKSVSTAPNAVQFVRAVYSGVSEKDQIEVKIISSYYSPINGQQTNEEGSGASSSQLSGKCVFMRNHCSAADPPNASTQSSGNVFQHD